MPRSIRDDPDRTAEYFALREGAPPGLHATLVTWCIDLVRSFNPGGRTVYDVRTLRELDRRLDLQLGLGNHLDLGHTFKDCLVDDEELLLDVVDFFLSHGRGSSEQVEEYLVEARSAWRVVETDGTSRLERRIARTVADAAEKAMGAGGRAGQLLASAWEHVYGRNPKPSLAYRDAVRAVEAAGKPIVSPENKRTSVGTIIRDLEQAPDKWNLVFETNEVAPVAVLTEMLRLLWKSQYDRHGTDDEAVPLEVSQEEAEAAIHLATTLVHWFTSAVVRRVNR